MPYPCFLLEETTKVRLSLRRYRSTSSGDKCPGPMGYHDAQVPFGEIEVPKRELGDFDRFDTDTLKPPNDDSRWPRVCSCGFVFSEEDAYQLFTDKLWLRKETGEIFTLRDVPVGAMWYADWMNGMYWDNQEGPSLIVKTPGGDWNIDGQATNCTMLNDRLHRCWVRHGEPPNIHVDKNGHTCGAGAGSILSGNYHGFLHGGCLTDNM